MNVHLATLTRFSRLHFLQETIYKGLPLIKFCSRRDLIKGSPAINITIHYWFCKIKSFFIML